MPEIVVVLNILIITNGHTNMNKEERYNHVEDSRVKFQQTCVINQPATYRKHAHWHSLHVNVKTDTTDNTLEPVFVPNPAGNE